MDYLAIYVRLINRADRRKFNDSNTIVERHHIIPKCIGGGDESNNIAILTLKEHYIAHLLLIKIFPDFPDLIFALEAFYHKKRFHNFEKRMPRYIRKKIHLRRVALFRECKKR